MQSRKKWDLMVWIILFHKYEKSPEAAIFSLSLLSRNFALIIFEYIYIFSLKKLFFFSFPVKTRTLSFFIFLF